MSASRHWSWAARIAFFCLLSSAAGAGSAAAAGLFDAAGAADARTAAAQAAPSDPQAVRNRLVRVNAGELARHVVPAGLDKSTQRVARARQLDGVVQIELFPGTILNLRRTDVSANADGGYVWAGQSDEKTFHEALLIVENGKISGRVQMHDRLFRIDHVSGAVHRITELNSQQFPPEAPPRVAPPAAGQSGSSTQAPDAVAPNAVAKVKVRVLVAYTTAAQSRSPNINTEISQAISLANQAYTRGNIPIVLELAGKMRPAYNENAGYEQNLTDLTSGASLKSVRTRRASLRADLAVLLRRSGEFCGIAWLPPNGGSPAMPRPSAATRETGYSIVGRDCITNLSFHHELGHNMGLNHDRYVSSQAANNVYNYGYVNRAERIRTIMAYNNDCAARGFNCPRVNYFSSPTVRAQPGNVLVGKAQNASGAADNTRRLREIRNLIGNYYPPPAADTQTEAATADASAE